MVVLVVRRTCTLPRIHYFHIQESSDDNNPEWKSLQRIDDPIYPGKPAAPRSQMVYDHARVRQMVHNVGEFADDAVVDGLRGQDTLVDGYPLETHVIRNGAVELPRPCPHHPVLLELGAVVPWQNLVQADHVARLAGGGFLGECCRWGSGNGDGLFVASWGVEQKEV